MFKKPKSIKRKDGKVPIATGLRKDRKELIIKVLTLYALRLLSVPRLRKTFFTIPREGGNL